MSKSNETVHLRLFVAGTGSDSAEAIKNLDQLKAEGLANDSIVEIIDIKEEPDLALENMVIVVPMLVMEAPEPKVTIIGSLSDTTKVWAALRIYPKELQHAKSPA